MTDARLVAQLRAEVEVLKAERGRAASSFAAALNRMLDDVQYFRARSAAAELKLNAIADLLEEWRVAFEGNPEMLETMASIGVTLRG